MQRKIRERVNREFKAFFNRQSIDKSNSSNAMWHEAITKSLEHFKGSDKYELIIAKYLRKQSEVQTCLSLHIEKTTYYSWQNEVITTTFVFAAMIGLIEYDSSVKGFIVK